MALNLGSRLSPYDCADQIGAGGVREVCTATGTCLDRLVAIRVGASITVQALCWGLVAAALLTATVQAQQPPADRSVVIDGPPPPQPPETIARDADGRVTIRSHRVTEALTIDGVLDERVYRDVPPASGFIQAEPLEGEQATE